MNMSLINNIKRTIKHLDYSSLAPLIALIVLFVISSIASPYFLSTRNILNILRQASYTGIIALGMTFVIITGGIDLSVGSMTAFVGGITIMVLNALGGGYLAVLVSILVALGIGTLAGSLNGFLVTKGRIAPFIVTLATMSIFRSMALYMSGAGEFRSYSNIYPQIGSSYFLGIPTPVWIFIIVTVSFHLLLNNTKFGRYACAVGYNERVARYSAIKVDLIKFVSYAITGLTVGITAILLSSRLNSVSSSNTGLSYELDAIAAVVIGGTTLSGGKGSILGTFIGAFVLGIINNMLNMLGVSPYLQGTVKGIVILGAVLMQYSKNQS